MRSNAQYADKDYWESRFEKESHYEWLAGFDSYREVLLKYLPPDQSILHIGCGSSDLSMRLYELGFKNITNVDYSETLISSRKEQFPEMEWICDDITSLSEIKDGSFDIVLEKATIEALLVKEKSAWSPSSSALSTIDSVWTAIDRVLKKGGLFLSISFTQPHFRIPALLRNPKWNIETDSFGEFFHFFVYVCRKGEDNREMMERYSKIAPDWLRSATEE
ncbi:hypothetical protein PENTCL1PPCAC_23089 [Pristionchus entomophagus]|uniref:Methyltransferase type 11 domain-containing protein n=1 Tax=Pristionchus entomophagus TaxID=358040 RepID=A0AAV5U3U3_9BILA|nr:hypothetical protein PENTCL1PPCAC_23089 [Pristionchus entomophagus]